MWCLRECKLEHYEMKLVCGYVNLIVDTVSQHRRLKIFSTQSCNMTERVKQWDDKYWCDNIETLVLSLNS